MYVSMSLGWCHVVRRGWGWWRREGIGVGIGDGVARGADFCGEGYFGWLFHMCILVLCK